MEVVNENNATTASRGKGRVMKNSCGEKADEYRLGHVLEVKLEIPEVTTGGQSESLQFYFMYIVSDMTSCFDWEGKVTKMGCAKPQLCWFFVVGLEKSEMALWLPTA